MSPERWRKIEEIFQAAAEHPTADRDAFLTQVCGSDDELRTEVASLLVHAVEAPFIESAIACGAQLLERDDQEAVIGRRIGAYRVTSLIGHGGMGTVYAAVRDDDQYRQQVALKLVKRGMDTQSVLRRFRHERQILASLEHPHIARLLDGGTTDEGLPYFVMEHITGQEITRYCETHKLSIPERLQLLRQVCAAVQYAHQKLIIHRDLKPSNILVTEDGQAKLLDFGIAKLLAPDDSAEASARTATGLAMMTPDYASPEQVRGESVTTATDIYGLGAVLYELLTFQRPRRFTSYSAAEIERVVCETPTAKPSAVATSPRLRRQLSGDLDNIVLMALRQEPERRYQSAEQFSDDLLRHMEGRPVRARRDTHGYRAGKFVRRHKLGLAATALVILSLVGGIVTTSHQARRAERRFQQVRRLANTFLFDFHDKIKELPGSTEAREMVVKTALEYLDSLAQEAEGDPALQLELAQAYQGVGDVQGDVRGASLGRAGEAMESYRKALALGRRLAERDPDDLSALRLLSACYAKLGDTQAETGDRAGGMETLREGLRLGESVYARHTGELADMMLLIRGYERLGDAQLETRDAAGALDSYSRTLQVSEQRAAEFPSDRAQHSLALTHSRVGDALAESGDLAGTMESYRRAVQIREALARDHPSNAMYLRELKVVYNWLGNYSGNPQFINLGDRTAALSYYRQGLVISEELAAADPKNAQARLDLAVSCGKMGDILSDSDPALAAEYYRKALAITRALLNDAPGEFRYLRRQAIFLRTLAAPLRKLGDHQSALQHLRQSLKMLRAMSAEHQGNPEVQAATHATLLALASLLLDTGDLTAAQEHNQQALAIAEAALSSNPKDLYAAWRLADSYASFGQFHASLGADPRNANDQRLASWREARTWSQKTLDLWDRWNRQAASSAFSITRREQAARALAQTEAALAKFAPRP